MSEEQPVFKVTDRRLFNADGSPREIEGEAETKTDAPPAKTEPSTSTDEERAAPAQAATAAAQSAPSVSSAPPDDSDSIPTEANAVSPTPADEFPEDNYAESQIPGADDPSSFINFLMSIASNAAAALGMMEHPVTGQRAVDIELGKHWIDVLGMLQEKTKGNLAPQEQQVFEGLLADLRMQYVSLTNTGQPKGPRGFSGSDITGGK